MIKNKMFCLILKDSTRNQSQAETLQLKVPGLHIGSILSKCKRHRLAFNHHTVLQLVWPYRAAIAHFVDIAYVEIL